MAAEKSRRSSDAASEPTIIGNDEERDVGVLSKSSSSVDGHELKRGLKARHVSMIAMGGAVGLGLMIGSGAGLARYGPGAMLIAFLAIAFLVALVMSALGEMAAYLPLAAGFQAYASRFCHPSLGPTIGINYLIKYLIVTPNQLTATAMIMGYWIAAEAISPGVWIVAFHFAIGFFNLVGVDYFGEIEFWLSAAKIFILLGLIIFMLIMTCGGLPTYPIKGGWTWDDPGAFRSIDGLNEQLGQFLNMIFSLSFAVFAYLGTELVGVTVGEAQNPRKCIPKAMKLTFGRVLVFYCLTTLLLGLNLPYNSPALQFSESAGKGSVAASPFVALTQQAGLTTLTNIINGALLVFIMSSANSDLYIASRTMYGLAEQGTLPAFFKRTWRFSSCKLFRRKKNQQECSGSEKKQGVPVVCVFVSWLFASLAYITVVGGVKTVFGYFVDIVTVNGLITWATISYCHIHFVWARRAQGIHDRDLPYKAPCGIWGSWIAFISACFFIIMKGVEPAILFYTDKINRTTLVIKLAAAYASPILFWIVFTWRAVHRGEKWIAPADADLITGKAQIDKEEQEFLQEEAEKKAKEREHQISKHSWKLVGSQIYHYSVGLLF